MSDISLIERAEILSKAYAAIQIYFAHWQAIPDFNLDSSYKETLKQALEAPDRRAFSLILMRFVAQLKNGHSIYRDNWLWQQQQPYAFHMLPYDDQWVVTHSSIAGIKIGDIILQIDERTPEAHFQDIRPYISASSDREARYQFSNYLRLFLPERSIVHLGNGRVVEINHAQSPLVALIISAKTEGRWLVENRIAYIDIPSFNAPHFEESAIELVKQFTGANTLIIDVRKNGGGSTPSELIACLMDRPYQFYMEHTPAIYGLFRYYSQQNEGFNDFRSFSATSLAWPAEINQPKNLLFSGQIMILTSGYTASAAEDFTIPFKNNRRATLIGETTFGSTGQPYFHRFENDIFLIISTKRAFFPDGSPFEGIGIQPDIAIRASLEDLQQGRDTVLEYAERLATTPAT